MKTRYLIRNIFVALQSFFADRYDYTSISTEATLGLTKPKFNFVLPFAADWTHNNDLEKVSSEAWRENGVFPLPNAKNTFMCLKVSRKENANSRTF